jgi:hypothetical protein
MPRLLSLLIGAYEFQLDEVSPEGVDERINQRVGGGALRTQDRERIVDWR